MEKEKASSYLHTVYFWNSKFRVHKYDVRTMYVVHKFTLDFIVKFPGWGKHDDDDSKLSRTIIKIPGIRTYVRRQCSKVRTRWVNKVEVVMIKMEGISSCFGNHITMSLYSIDIYLCRAPVLHESSRTEKLLPHWYHISHDIPLITFLPIYLSTFYTLRDRDNRGIASINLITQTHII